MNHNATYSQCGQDQWVLERHKNRGFFVEVGAFDGITFSNTKFLEELGWQGLCVEPNPNEFKKLCENRNCQVCSYAIASHSGQTRDFKPHGLFGGFTEHLNHEQAEEVSSISVQTISLNDLLNQFNCPRSIEYISLDTEGSELEILEHFDFSSYQIDLWTVEHNDYTRNNNERSSALIKLFSQHGYKHQIVEFDAWFYKI